MTTINKNYEGITDEGSYYSIEGIYDPDTDLESLLIFVKESIEVELDKRLEIKASVYCDDFKANCNVDIKGALYARGDINVDGYLATQTWIDDEYQQHDNTNIVANGNINVSGDLYSNRGIEADGNINVGHSIEAIGDVSAKGDINAAYNITSGGYISTLSNLCVGGNVEAKGFVDVEGNMTAGRDVEVSDYIEVGGDFKAKSSVRVAMKLGGGEGYLNVGGNIEAGALEVFDYIRAGGDTIACDDIDCDNVSKGGGRIRRF